MKAFTYKDYIKCIHTLRLNAAFKIAEESTRYSFYKDKEDECKIIKDILKETKEMTLFVNELLEVSEKLQNKDLIKYDSKYICSKYRIDQGKLIYKVKNKDTFYLVEEVKEIDNIVLYEILNYCISLMQEWNLSNKIRGERKYPIIVPIIIYSGKKKYNINKKNDLYRKQVGDFIFKNYNINLNYNLVDINKLSAEILIKKDCLLSYAILLERIRNNTDFDKNTNKIITKIKNEKRLSTLLKYIPSDHISS